MKKHFIKLSSLLIIPILALCLAFSGCGKNKDGNANLSLGEVLSKLSDRTGDFKITGTGKVDNDELNYHSTVEEVVYKVWSYNSYSYDKTSDGTKIWFTEKYFDSYNSKSYSRSRTEGATWGQCSTATTSNTNAFLSDADFRQISEDMFLTEGNVHTLNSALTLSPYWDGWISSLTTLKIEAKQNGASVSFSGNGVFNSVAVNVEFNFEIEFGQGYFATPRWIN
jgi:hypothetical protein